MTRHYNNQTAAWEDDYHAYYDEDRSHDITLGWFVALFVFVGLSAAANAAQYAIERIRALMPNDPPTQQRPPATPLPEDRERTAWVGDEPQPV